MYRKLNRRHIQYITKTLRQHHKILPAIFKTVYKTTLNLSYIAKKESARQFALAPQQKHAGTMSLQSVNLYCRLRESCKVWELINRRGLRQGIPPVELYYQCENRRWSPAKKETGLATWHVLQTKEIMVSELDLHSRLNVRTRSYI